MKKSNSLVRFEKTNDGSFTAFSDRYKAHYHSTHGAITESVHVFIEKGFHRVLLDGHWSHSIKILELGFGTGLNAILAFSFAKVFDCATHYLGLEPFPILEEEALLNMIKQEDIASAEDMFRRMHRSSSSCLEIGNFKFQVKSVSFLEFQTEDHFDLIFYDAFGPNVQPDLWGENALGKCFDLLNPGGVWVSYCAKGEVKRTLKKSGFNVEKMAGPPGKRDMLRGRKPVNGSF